MTIKRAYDALRIGFLAAPHVLISIYREYKHPNGGGPGSETVEYLLTYYRAAPKPTFISLTDAFLYFTARSVPSAILILNRKYDPHNQIILGAGGTCGNLLFEDLQRWWEEEEIK